MVDDDRVGAGDSRAWLRIFLPFALGYYLSYLLRTVNAVISPALTEALGLTAASLGLLTSTYFLAFGLAQIPVGMALDRFGPRRVEAALLLLTALGSGLFALGDSLAGLGLARALIGVGVSACLMAALKGFALWYPPERQSSMIGFIMAAGALGALTASVPVEAVLPFLGWRGLFWAIAATALFASVLLWRSLPEAGRGGIAPRGSLGDALRVVAGIYVTPAFLRFAASSTFFVGGFMALQSLWVVPWLMHVDGFDLGQAAAMLVVLNLGSLCGQLSIGLMGVRLAHRGIGALALLRWGYVGVLAVQVAILFSAGPAPLLWFVFGMLSAANSQTYLAASRAFPPSLFGRVSTAINLMAFTGAFVVQWGLGLALDLLQSQGHGLGAALRFGFTGLIVLQALSLLPLLRSSGRHPGGVEG